MKRLLIIFCLLCNILVQAQDERLQWTKRFGGTITTFNPYASTTDNDGSIYVAAAFRGTITLDNIVITASTTVNDGVVIKLDKLGNVVWAKHLTGTGTETITSMIVIGNYIYIVGYSNSNPCIIDGNNTTTYGDYDSFLYKLKTDGTYLWVKNISYGTTAQTTPIFGTGFSMDKDSNLLINTNFTTSATLYGGTVISSIYTKQQPLLIKSDTSGNVIWSKVLPCTSTVTGGTLNSISISDSIYYISGYFTDTIVTDIRTITAVASNDIFIYACDYNGNGKWSRRIGGTLADTHPYSVYKDNLFYTAIRYTSATLIVDSTNTEVSISTYPNAGISNQDILYVIYDENGTLQFAKRYGGTGDDINLTLSMNKDLVFLNGSYGANISFDSYNLISVAPQDGYFVTLKDGIAVSAVSCVGSVNDLFRFEIADNQSNIIIVATSSSNPYTINGIPYSRIGAIDLIIQKYTSPYKVLSTGNKVLTFGNKVINYK